MTTRAWVIICIELLLSVLVAYVLLGQISAEKKRADDANSLAKQRQETINNIQINQRDVAALDDKYTGELADAKATIDQLERDVADGRKRLRLNARCPAASDTTATGSVGDASSPRLNYSAERDYFTLRQRISTITGQVNYLQKYIIEQCLR